MNDRPDALLRRFDVCNGDADGLCAVRQWRLHEPLPSVLVTGLKREIDLLKRVPVDGADEVLVCDLSMQRNRPALMALLDAGVPVRYVDHHASGPVPDLPHLQAHIDTRSEVCTSLLMDRLLHGRFRPWALVGAYGDDLGAVADRLAADLGLTGRQRCALRSLGQAINYNAYGEDEHDVLVEPAAMHALLSCYGDPFDLLRHEPVISDIDDQRRDDLERGRLLTPWWQNAETRVLVLPDAHWSRRVSGSLANELAAAEPERALAVLTPRRDGGWVVSVRAPRARPCGANEVVAAFGGNGRAAAAGIDRLAPHELDRFVRVLSSASWSARSVGVP
jgi:hypothetical protein